MPKRSGGPAVADEEEGAGARRAMRKEATAAGKAVRTDPQWDGLLEPNHTASPTKSAIKPRRGAAGGDEEAAGVKLSALKQKMSLQVRAGGACTRRRPTRA